MFHFQAEMTLTCMGCFHKIFFTMCNNVQQCYHVYNEQVTNQSLRTTQHPNGFFFMISFILHCLESRTRPILTPYMVGAGGTLTCEHPHVSRPLYHCAMDADS